MGSEEASVYYALLIAGFMFFLVFVSFVVSIFKNRKKSLATYQKNTERDLKIIEREKKRIAADIHDGIGANVSAIKLLVDELLMSGQADGALKSKIALTIQRMSLSVKEVSGNMVPYALQREGLINALTELTKALFPGSVIKITTQFEFHETMVGEERAMHIYRIVHELLNNIVKHSKATAVHLSLLEQNRTLILHIKDNGVGFNQEKIKKSTQGLGLINISTRVILLKGNIYLNTSPGKGTEWIIELPLAYDMIRSRI